MARKGGLTPMWSDREVGRWFDYYVDRAEERIYKLLQRAGEEKKGTIRIIPVTSVAQSVM